MKTYIIALALILMTGCTTPRTAWDWVTLVEVNAEDLDGLLDALHASGVDRTLTGASMTTGAIGVFHPDFAKAQSVVSASVAENQIGACVRKEWDQPVYILYREGKPFSQEQISFFKTMDAQGRIAEPVR